MIKQISVKNVWERRPRIVNQMFCDNCGRKIEWCLPHPKGHYCEKCLKEIKQQQSDTNR